MPQSHSKYYTIVKSFKASEKDDYKQNLRLDERITKPHNMGGESVCFLVKNTSSSSMPSKADFNRFFENEKKKKAKNELLVVQATQLAMLASNLSHNVGNDYKSR